MSLVAARAGKVVPGLECSWLGSRRSFIDEIQSTLTIAEPYSGERIDAIAVAFFSIK
jgi:hypothetical protein